MEAGVRLPLNMKYYELLSIYQYLKENWPFNQSLPLHGHKLIMIDCIAFGQVSSLQQPLPYLSWNLVISDKIRCCGYLWVF